MKLLTVFFTALYTLWATTFTFAQSGKIFLQTLDNRLYAVDIVTGKRLWVRTDMDGLKYTPPTIVNEIVYTSRYQNNNPGRTFNLVALDAKTGQTKWEYKLDPSGFVDESQDCSPVVSKGVVYFGTKKDFYAIDAETGQKKWSRSGIGTFDSPTVYQNTIFTNTVAGKFFALSTLDGSTIWQSSSTRYHSGNPVVSSTEKLVFTGTSTDTRNTYLTGFDLTTGTIKYDAIYKGNTISRLNLVKEYLVFSNSSSLYVINIKTKQTEYTRESTFGFEDPYIIDGLLQIIDGGGPVLYDITAKKIITDLPFRSPLLKAIYLNNIVYGSNFSRAGDLFAFVAFDTKTGKEKWTVDLTNRDLSASPVLMLDDGKTYYPPSSGMDEEYTTTVTGAPTLTLSNEAKSVAQTGEVGSLTISSSGSWSATTNAAWLRVSPAAGTSTTSGVVSYTVDANTATAGRSGIVTFNAAGLSKTFTATQAGKPADVLTTSGPDSYTISYLSGTGSFTLTANPSWSIASNATWLTVSQASGTSTTGTIVQYTATANETSASRTATLTVQAGSLSKVLTVVQDGVYFSTASPGSLTAPGGGLTGRFTFSATRPWKITPANAWVIASPMSGTAGTGVPVSYTIAANTTQQLRSTRLNIEEPGGSRQPYSVSVVQASILPVFGLSSTSTAGTSLAQTGTFSVSANVAWTATTDANWITLSQTSAVAGVSSLSYTASANSLPATRTGTITLTGRWTDVDAATKQVTAAHTVTQAALILSTEPTTLPGLTVSVYPNPTTDWVTARIHADKPQSVQISLYNAVGRLYQTRKADVLTGEQMITLDLRAAEAGMYVIRVENQEGQQLSQKIIRH